MSEKVYSRITEAILHRLEQGIVPWHKPWRQAGFPMNLVSQRRYRGINVFILGSQGYGSPYWLSFRQASELGGSVRKGEKATPVVFWKWQDKEFEAAEEKKTARIPLIRYYHVFNVEQTEGISYPKAPVPEVKPIAAAERVLMWYEDPPRIERGNQACYRPQDDAIVMPVKERFPKMEEYYSTLFHELTHSTGHEKRLARKTLTDLCPFGSTNYSREELVAEMGAAMLSGECGIEQVVIDNSASYIAGWLKRLQNDRRLVVVAAGQAQQAVDHILGRRFTIADSAGSAQEVSGEETVEDAHLG